MSLQYALPFFGLVLSYLLGSVSFAVFISKRFKLTDPRQYGSNNPGVSNVLRRGHRWAAFLTLLGDVSKGIIAVLLMGWIVARWKLPNVWIALAMLSVTAGHLWPVFFHFRGGKGVATTVGTLFALDWRVGIGTTAIWLIILWLTRVSSIAALGAVLIAPLLAFFYQLEAVLCYSTVILSAVVIWRHRDNISRIIRGTEKRID